MTEFLLVAAILPLVILKLSSKKVYNNYIATKNILSCIIIFDTIPDALMISVFMIHSYLALCVQEQNL